MYQIPPASDMRPPGAPSLLRIGLEWLLGYAGLGALGGAAAFGLRLAFDSRLLLDATASFVLAWSLVAALCGPLAILIQQRALRSSGLRFRRWLRASWLILLLLGLGCLLVVGAAALLTGRPMTAVLANPLAILDALALLGVSVALPEQALVLGIRGLAGLLIGLVQAQVWRAQRLFFCLWVAACAGAGLASGVGEDAGWALAKGVTARLCAVPGRVCADPLLAALVEGACYWGATWLAMALVTVGPALYLISRLRSLPAAPDLSLAAQAPVARTIDLPPERL